MRTYGKQDKIPVGILPVIILPIRYSKRVPIKENCAHHFFHPDVDVNVAARIRTRRNFLLVKTLLSPLLDRRRIVRRSQESVRQKSIRVGFFDASLFAANIEIRKDVI